MEIQRLLINKVLMLLRGRNKLLFFSALICFASCCYPVRYDGPYRGKVVDMDTGKPIENVVVLGIWYKEIATAAGGVSSFYDAEETVTDRNGNFEIRGKGLKLMTNVGPMRVLIFKAGFTSIGPGLWESLSIDGGLLTKKATWEDSRAVIPLKRLTLSERNQQGSPDFPSQIPQYEMPLMLREINLDRTQRGLDQYHLEK